MAVVRGEVCIRDDEKTSEAYEVSKWRVILTFVDDMDVSRFCSGYDVAVALGDFLKEFLHNQPNSPGVLKNIDAPAYIYGQTRATATIFFEGILETKQSACMRACLHCEWVDYKPFK